jgi:hypothetical protein
VSRRGEPGTPLTPLAAAAPLAAPGGAAGASSRTRAEPQREAERPPERALERGPERVSERPPHRAPERPPDRAAEREPRAPDEAALRIAWLEGKVAALEAALERRSDELLMLQRCLCAHDLVQWMRLTTGLPPLPRVPYEPAFWRETCELTMAEVPETLDALWSSIYTPRPR